MSETVEESTLCEVPCDRCWGPLPKRAWDFIEEGLRQGQRIACFDFVPSSYAVVYAVLSALPRGRFCEWGSGMGIVTGLAEMLGFDAHGIEIDAALATASRRLLADFGLSVPIETGDYLELRREADLYYVYCWPGQIPHVEHCFLATAPQPARLLLARGCDDIRCYVKHRPSPQPSGASPAKAPALAIRGWQVDAERAGSRESAARRPP